MAVAETADPVAETVNPVAETANAVAETTDSIAETSRQSTQIPPCVIRDSRSTFYGMIAEG